jgi:hypothetical protein
MKNNKNIFIMFACFIVLLIINSIFIFRNPWFDWDIVSYIWNVKYIENKNIEEVHKETYEELENYLDAWRYNIILNANSYRKDVYKEYGAFLDIMPFYNIKFIYIYTIYGINKLWLWIIDSIIAISIISYLIFCSLLFFIFRKELEKYPILFFVLYWLSFSSPILIAWRSTTPDMFWALFLMIWTFLVLKKQVLWWIIILILSLGARTDNIIFIWVLLFYLRFFWDKSIRISTISFIGWSIIALGFYKWINTYFDNFWYVKLYYNSFIEPISYPSTFVPNLVPMDYLVILKDKVAIMLGLRENRPPTFFPFYIILSIVAIIMAQKNKIRLNNIYLWLLLISVFTLLFKFAIFPNIQERYFVFYFIIIFIALTKFMLNVEEVKVKN